LLFSLQSVTHSSHQRVAQKRLVGFSVNNFPQEQQTYKSLLAHVSYIFDVLTRCLQSMASIDGLTRCSQSMFIGCKRWIRRGNKSMG